MAFIFKINIKSKSPIWRRLKMNENISFADFGMVIQILFGYQIDQMYQFLPTSLSNIPRIMMVQKWLSMRFQAPNHFLMTNEK